MRRCDCGQKITLLSPVDVCPTCLKKYLDELPDRAGFTITEFRVEQQHKRQMAALHTRVAQAPQRVRLLNTTIDPLTLAEAMHEVERYVESGLPHQLVTVNVDFVRIAQENEQFRRILNNSDLSVADGKPLLWAARWTGQELPARITGMDLVLGCAELAERRNEAMFFLGAAEGVAAKAALALRGDYPDLKVHTYSPPMGPFSDEENAKMVSMIRESGAKYLFVAFGAPKQDVWIMEHMHELGVPVCAGVGGIFNFLAGAVQRAPEWMQRSGFEWVYRIMQEPGRLWRRYIVQDLPVFARMMMQPVTTTMYSTITAPPLPVATAEYEAQRSSFERFLGGS